MDDFSDEVPFWDAPAGKPIVVLPYQLDTNDMKMWPNPGLTARDWLDYAIDTFDLLYEEGEQSPRMMSLGVHLRIIGRPGRAAAFGRFLDYVARKDDVWIATRLEIAEHFRPHPALSGAMTTYADGALRLQVDGPVATVILNRPEARNALNVAMWRAWPQLLSDLNPRREVRALVVRGAGGHFASGARYQRVRRCVRRSRQRPGLRALA